MRVLMLSGDPAVLRPGTPAHDRLVLQRSQVEELVPVVWTPRSFFSVFEMLWLALRTRFDVVTVQDPLWRGVVGVVAAKLSHARLQVQVHTDIFSPHFSVWQRRLAVWVLRHADSIRVVSSRITDSLVPLSLSARITVLPIYVDFDAIDSAPPFNFAEVYPQFESIVLVVARLEKEKGVDDALRVFSDVLKTFPRAGLCIVGEGSERARLEAFAGDLGVRSSVVFMGRRADVFSLYKGADVLLQCSHYEGYGAAVVEALCAGTPVVSTDVGVAKEAGARVGAVSELPGLVSGALNEEAPGALLLPRLSKEAWAGAWKASL